MNHAQKRALAMLLSLPAYCFGVRSHKRLRHLQQTKST